MKISTLYKPFCPFLSFFFLILFHRLQTNKTKKKETKHDRNKISKSKLFIYHTKKKKNNVNLCFEFCLSSPYHSAYNYN
jgi:hypothetical protein